MITKVLGSLKKFVPIWRQKEAAPPVRLRKDISVVFNECSANKDFFSHLSQKTQETQEKYKVSLWDPQNVEKLRTIYSGAAERGYITREEYKESCDLANMLLPHLLLSIWDNMDDYRDAPEPHPRAAIRVFNPAS